MTVNTRELIEAVSVVADNHNVRVAVKSSLRASVLVAGATFAGALLMGPLGILIGSTGGGLYSYLKSKDSFKSVALILKDDLSHEQQQILLRHIHEAFKNFGVEDVMMLIPMLASNAPLQKLVLQKVAQFLAQELQMNVID